LQEISDTVKEYRLVHFPPGEHEELVAACLWTDAQGVLSHQTDLSLHSFSLVLPEQIHLTLPLAWQRRRVSVPGGLILHYAAVSFAERTWINAVPISSVRRTLIDCTVTSLPPDPLRQAARQALRRGRVTKPELTEVERPWSRLAGSTDDRAILRLAACLRTGVGAATEVGID
jgi:hypothetical protein